VDRLIELDSATNKPDEAKRSGDVRSWRSMPKLPQRRRRGIDAFHIRGKQIAGAAIDVFDPEPLRADYPLLGFDNVLLTPHMAARTHTAVENMSWVVGVLNGRPPTYPASGAA
jgi:hypothetical protein